MGKRNRFIAGVLGSDTDDCIDWPFAVRESSGYGAHSGKRDGARFSADSHRHVCTLAHGEPAKGMQAAHSCDNRLCCNPRHLSWKTAKANMEEASERNRMVGGGRYRQRIFAADVARIVQSSLSVPQLAREYGMAPATSRT